MLVDVGSPAVVGIVACCGARYGCADDALPPEYPTQRKNLALAHNTLHESDE